MPALVRPVAGASSHEAAHLHVVASLGRVAPTMLKRSNLDSWMRAFQTVAGQDTPSG